jgi:beta-N-acetylhexosaminidase
VEGVKSGRIPMERLNQSVKRILALKESYFQSSSNLDIESVVNTIESQAIAKKIAKLGLQVEKQDRELLRSITQKKIVVFSPKIIEKALMCSSISRLGEPSFLFFYDLNPNENEIQSAKAAAEKSDMLIFFSYNAWKNPSQERLANSLLDLGKPMVLVCLRDPIDSTLFPRAQMIIHTYSPTLPSIQAVVELLTDVQDNPRNGS